MKKLLKKLAIGIIATAMFSSCVTISRTSRAALDVPGLTYERSDYTLSDDISAEVEVKVILGFIYKGIDKRNIKIGQLNGRSAGSIDQQMAVFNLIEKNPEVDYLTNIRYFKTYTKKLFSKTYKTKIVAKGITIKTDK